MTLHLARVYSLLFFPPRMCLWNCGGGGESTTLRDCDLICILWSCVLVVSVDNWSMPLIPAACLYTVETVISWDSCIECMSRSERTCGKLWSWHNDRPQKGAYLDYKWILSWGLWAFQMCAPCCFIFRYPPPKKKPKKTNKTKLQLQ